MYMYLWAVLASSATHSANAILTMTSLSLGMWCCVQMTALYDIHMYMYMYTYV